VPPPTKTSDSRRPVFHTARPASSREVRLSPDRLIEEWASVSIRVDGTGLGHARSSPIWRAMNGHLATGGDYGSALPRGVQIPGLRGYIRVERVLRRLGPHYRQTLEAVHVKSSVETGRTLRQIADYLGLTLSGLTTRLSRFKEHLRDDGAQL